MKNNGLAVIILVVATALMVFFQQKSMGLREMDRKEDLGVSYLERSKMLTAGFDAVVADFIWMRTNLKREPKVKKGISEEEKRAFRKKLSERNFAGYSKVLALDPTFKKAYNFAILRIMNDLPDQAISLAELAMLYIDGGKKEFAEMAGHVASTIQKDHKKALGFYEICVEGTPSKDYLGRRYLRTILRTKGIDPYEKSLDGLSTRIHSYHAEYLKVKEAKGTEENDMIGLEGVQEGESGEHWIQTIVIKHVKDFMSRAHLEKAPAAMVGKIEGIYASYKPVGNNCSRCYQAYEAGDQFCHSCGLGLEIYGACLRDQTVLRGQFCHVCGLEEGKKP